MAQTPVQAVHFKLNNQHLTADAIAQLKTEIQKNSGEQPVFLHTFTDKQNLVIIKANNTGIALAPDAADTLTTLLELDVVDDVQFLDATIEQYTLLKDVFDPQHQASQFQLLKLNQKYFELLQTTTTSPMTAKILQHNSRVLDHSGSSMTLAFLDQNILDYFQSDQIAKKLEQAFGKMLNQPIHIQTTIVADLNVHLNQLSTIIASDLTEQAPGPVAPMPQASPSPARSSTRNTRRSRPKKRFKKKNIPVPSSPEEILSKTLDIFDGTMDTRLLPNMED